MIHVDERRNLIVPGDREATLTFAAQHWVECAHQAIAHHDAFYVALSGGSTPKAIYQRLVDYDLDWSKVYLFWSDERAVPPTDSESNYHMAMSAGFGVLPINHIFRMHAENDIEVNALWYAQQIASTLKNRPFDLMMLGMGDDGHTASLFPNTTALTRDDISVVANYVPQKKSWRMTLTLSRINHSHHIAFYVLGHEKQAMLKEILLPTSTLPAARVGTAKKPALWIADHEAIII